jgi:tripartite-type tricarboxylate transporter receptor subunit TctC
MHIQRRALGALGIAALAPRAARAQAFPTQPIRLVVPFPAGTLTDAIARMIGERASAELPQPIVVDNRAGAGGTIGAEYVAKQAPADGHTVFVGTTGNMAVGKALYRNLRYDPVADFAAVSLGWMSWNVLVVPAVSSYRSVAEVVAAARAAPDRLTYGSPGHGTAGHLVGEWFKTITGTAITHVPFRGGNQIVTELVAGRLDLSFEAVGNALPLITAGNLRPIAVTSEARLAVLPGVPTFAELGLRDLSLSAWGMFAVPARTPPAAVERLSDALGKAIRDPGVAQRMTAAGVHPAASTPAETRRFLEDEARRWEAVVKASGAQLD